MSVVIDWASVESSKIFFFFLKNAAPPDFSPLPHPAPLPTSLPLPLPLARSAVDRAAERRRDDAWLAESWRGGGQVLVVDPKGNAAGTADGLELLPAERAPAGDRKSTRLNSSHPVISYAVFCL